MKLFSTFPKEHPRLAKILEDLKGLNILPDSILLNHNLKKIDQQDSEIQFQDLIVMTLSEMPFTMSNDIVPAALLKRITHNYRLIINPDKLEMGKDFLLPYKANVLCQDVISELQLKWHRPDFTISVLDSQSNILKHDAALLSSELDISQVNLWLTYEIQISEIIPYAGAGVIVLLCHKENIELRKTLKKLHCDTTSRCTNIERSILKAHSLEHRPYIGVHCEQDEESNYQVHAISLLPDQEVKKVHYSSVTSFELDKIILEKLL